MSKKQPKESTTPQKDNLKEVRDLLREQFGEDIVRRYDKAFKTPTLSTGIIGLDKALGGGLPEGRMIELYGAPSSGKTSICYSAMAQAQKKYPDKSCVYIDVEKTFDSIWVTKLGVDLHKFEHVIPEFGEDAIAALEQYLLSGQCSIIMIDSVAALSPKSELEGDIGNANVGAQARLISQAMRRISAVIHKFPQTTILLINQKRAKLNGGPASFNIDPTKTTGGMALPFYVTTRLEVVRIQTLKNTDSVEVGQVVRVKLVKNKINTGPGDTATFQINKNGIDTAQELLEFGIRSELVNKSGAWFVFKDGDKVQGEEKAKAIIREKHLTEWLEAARNEGTNETKSSEPEEN